MNLESWYARRVLLLWALLFAQLSPGTASAADTGLEALEPDAGAQAIIDGLDAREGALLPSFRVVGPRDGLDAHPTFAKRGPGTRDYSTKWVWAADRGRALYCGGNHGVPHKFNDVWEFDLERNAWAMLHPPDPGVSTLHTWWGLTYDSRRGRLLWMASRSKWPTANRDGPPLMSYDPSAREGWRQVRTRPDIKTPPGGALTYLPERDLVLWYANNWNGSGLQALDPESGTWQERLSVKEVYFNNPDAPGREAIINHDTRAHKLVAFLNAAVYVYDIDGNRWMRLHESLLPVRVRDAGVASDYDPVNGIHMIFASGRLFAYDLRQDRLEELTDRSMPMNGGTMGYFDREREVFVLYDGSPRVYVYRYGEPPGADAD